MVSIAAHRLPMKLASAPQILDSVRGAGVLPVVSETTSDVVDAPPSLLNSAQIPEAQYSALGPGLIYCS